MGTCWLPYYSGITYWEHSTASYWVVVYIDAEYMLIISVRNHFSAYIMFPAIIIIQFDFFFLTDKIGHSFRKLRKAKKRNKNCDVYKRPIMFLIHWSYKGDNSCQKGPFYTSVFTLHFRYGQSETIVVSFCGEAELPPIHECRDKSRDKYC